MVETRGVPQGFLSYYHVMPSSRQYHAGDTKTVTAGRAFALTSSPLGGGEGEGLLALSSLLSFPPLPGLQKAAQTHRRSGGEFPLPACCFRLHTQVLCLWQEGKTNLSHDGLNPAHVPCWWVNNPTLPLGCGWEARKSRHRRIKKRRRFERLAATSQLSLW